MNKMQFDTLSEAKEFSAFAKSKGYVVSAPVKCKRPRTARKIYDLNGKLITSRWEIIMGVRGAGFKGGDIVEKVKEIKEKILPSKKEETSEPVDKYIKEEEKADKEDWKQSKEDAQYYTKMRHAEAKTEAKREYKEKLEQWKNEHPEVMAEMRSEGARRRAKARRERKEGKR